MKNTPENIKALEAQLKRCPRCGAVEILDPYVVDGEILSAVATCKDHNYARVLHTSPEASAAMG